MNDAMLEALLDDYETRSYTNSSNLCVLLFFEEMKSGLPRSILPSFARELARVDLELRWRRFFSAGEDAQGRPTSNAPDRLPALPTWADYCQKLNLEQSIEGICHEYRIRQLFGDRPTVSEFCECYPAHASELSEHLFNLGAELTEAAVRVSVSGRLVFGCHLPGHLEVGRQRIDEAPGPRLATEGQCQRLIIADVFAVNISRRQCELEVIALRRVLLQHRGEKGSVVLQHGKSLSGHESCEAELPVTLQISQITIDIG